MTRAFLIVAMLFSMMAPGFAAPRESFSDFVKSFEARAAQAGISRDFYRRATQGLTPDPAIKVAQGSQPEFEKPVWDYLEKRVTQSRITRGQKAFRANQSLFQQVGQKYGVDPYVLAAIWGIETDYGAIMDNPRYFKPVLRSLFSLVHQRRQRVEADEKELIAALRIAQDNQNATLRGSWAGALGHLQVMPSAFLRIGVDVDGDGKKDPHNSLADALGTSALWLRDLGYQSGHDWGYEVKLPQNFDYMLAGRRNFRSVGFFADRGVVRVMGRKFRDMDEKVFLYVPAGATGPKFLMTQNYLAFKGYNFADSYALTVAHLTDRLKGSGPLAQKWPNDAKFLNRQQRINLQTRLMELGYYSDKIDGRFGPISQEALRRWQADHGLKADGFATVPLYNRVMK